MLCPSCAAARQVQQSSASYWCLAAAVWCRGWASTAGRVCRALVPCSGDPGGSASRGGGWHELPLHVPPVPRHRGVLRGHGQRRQDRDRGCTGRDFPEEGEARPRSRVGPGGRGASVGTGQHRDLCPERCYLLPQAPTWQRDPGCGTWGSEVRTNAPGPPVLGSKGVKRPWQVAEHFPPHGSQAFGAILNLVPLAESVVKLTAVCMECFREAAYTKRLGLEKEVAPALCGRGRGRDSHSLRSRHPLIPVSPAARSR